MTVVLASVAFWTHAKLVLPGDFGEKTEVDFDARFRRLTSSERKLLNLRLTLGRLGTEALLAALRDAGDLPAGMELVGLTRLSGPMRSGIARRKGRALSKPFPGETRQNL